MGDSLPLMSTEMIGSGKDLTTDAAGVGLHPGVEAHVPCEHVTPSKGPMTNVAWVTFIGVMWLALVPGGHVLCQPIVEAKHLTAHGADECHVSPWRHLLHHW